MSAVTTPDEELRAAIFRLRQKGVPEVPDWLAEPLATLLKETADRYESATYTDKPECDCVPGGTCEHTELLYCAECDRLLVIETGDDTECNCWDTALAVARVINRTSPTKGEA